jgi:hypothetical protein
VSNPAVELRWQPVSLAKNASLSTTFYIAVANSGKSPGIIELDPSLESPDYNDLTPAPVMPAPIMPEPVGPPPTPRPTGRDSVPAPRVRRDSNPVRTPSPAPVVTPPAVTPPRGAVPGPPPPVNQRSDRDYALNLIEQIERLATGPNRAANQAEIARLTAELERVSARMGLHL